MQELIKRLCRFVDLKSVVTIAMATGLLVGFFKDKIPVEQFIPYVSMVFAFYFSKTDKEDKSNNEARG